MYRHASNYAFTFCKSESLDGVHELKMVILSIEFQKRDDKKPKKKQKHERYWGTLNF